MFNEKRAAQMAAYLLHRHGGKMSVSKLMTLMYLADRKSLELHGEPISGDSYTYVRDETKPEVCHLADEKGSSLSGMHHDKSANNTHND